MKKFIVLVIIFCAITISATASAARGVVAFYSQSSQKIIIATQMGFTCGNVMSLPWGLKRGDVVAGDLEAFASHEIYDLTADLSFTMWIDMYWASKEEALNWLERGY